MKNKWPMMFAAGWLTVTRDKKRNVPVAEQEFRWSDMAGFL